MNSRTIVGDSSPLISLSLIGQLELLPKLYSRVLIPPAVWNEVTVQGAGLPGAQAVSELKWLEIHEPMPAILQSLAILVDRGEAEAIALALGNPGSTVLLDDAQARRVAERFGVARIGTLGILRKARIAGLIGPIAPHVTTLRENGIYIRRELVEAVLRDLGEATNS